MSKMGQMKLQLEEEAVNDFLRKAKEDPCAAEEIYSSNLYTGPEKAPVRKDIGLALHWLRHGHRVARKGWNGKGLYLELQVPDIMSKMTIPYIYISTAQADLVPWQASQTDLLAEDWELV